MVKGCRHLAEVSEEYNPSSFSRLCSGAPLLLKGLLPEHKCLATQAVLPSAVITQIPRAENQISYPILGKDSPKLD